MSEPESQVLETSPIDADEPWVSLRRAREALGLSVGDVSAHLKLTVRQIEAIERGELDVLPGAAFARGFVRNYARFLGLEQDVFARALEQGIPGNGEALTTQINPAGLGTMPFNGAGRYASLPMVMGVLMLLALLSLGAYFRWFESRDEDLLARLPADSEVVGKVASIGDVQSSPIATVSPPAAQSDGVAGVSSSGTSQASAPTGVEQSTSTVPPAAASAVVVATTRQSAPAASASIPSGAADSSSDLQLNFDAEAWVEIRDVNGKPLLSRLNAAGTRQIVQGQPPFTLVVGNAGKVKLTWRGKDVDLRPYTKVDVARLSLQ